MNYFPLMKKFTYVNLYIFYSTAYFLITENYCLHIDGKSLLSILCCVCMHHHVQTIPGKSYVRGAGTRAPRLPSRFRS